MPQSTHCHPSLTFIACSLYNRVKTLKIRHTHTLSNFENTTCKHVPFTRQGTVCCEARQGPGCGGCVALCSAFLHAACWCRNTRGEAGAATQLPQPDTACCCGGNGRGFRGHRPAPAYMCFVPEGPRAVQASPQPTRQPTYVHSNKPGPVPSIAADHLTRNMPFTLRGGNTTFSRLTTKPTYNQCQNARHAQGTRPRHLPRRGADRFI